MKHLMLKTKILDFLNRIRANIVKGQNNLGNTATAGLAIGAQELSKLAGINLSADEFLAPIVTGKQCLL